MPLAWYIGPSTAAPDSSWQVRESVLTVSVALAIGIVVLGVVGHQVCQGEAVMGDDEVQAVVRFPAGKYGIDL